MLGMLLLAAALRGQTIVPLDQVACRGAAGPQIPVVLPAGVTSGFPMLKLVCATLDPAGFKLDTTVNPPALRVIVSAPPAASPVFVDSETPSGTIDGTNVAFTLKAAPVTGTAHVYLNGLRMTPGVDYALTGATLIFAASQVPSLSSTLTVDYRSQ